MDPAAAMPASAAQIALRERIERKKKKVVAAHNGNSTVFTLNFSAWKLKKGTKVSNARPKMRFSISR